MADRAPSSTGDRPTVPPGLEVAAAYAWRFLVVAAALLALLWLAVRLRLVVLPVILALFGTALLAPVVGWLNARGWPRSVATASSFVAALVLLTGVGFAIAPQMQEDFAELGPTISEGVEDVQRWLATGPLDIDQAQLEEFTDRVTQSVRENAQSIVGGVAAGAALAAEVVAGLLLAAVLTFFFCKDGPRIVDWAMRQVPAPRRDVVGRVGRRVWPVLGGYLRGVAVVGAFDAVLIGIGLFVLGVPLVLPIMILTFVGAYLPLIGAPLAGLVAALVALVSGGFAQALIVVAIVVAVQQLEGNVLHPVVLGRTFQLHPIVILVALTAGAVLAGVVGAFLAVPIAATLIAAGKELRPGEESAEAS